MSTSCRRGSDTSVLVHVGTGAAEPSTRLEPYYPGPPGGIVPLLESGGVGGRSLERWMLAFGTLWKSFVGVSEKTLLESDLIWHAVFGKFECGEVLADLTSFQLIGHCLLCVARDRIVKFLM